MERNSPDGSLDDLLGETDSAPQDGPKDELDQLLGSSDEEGGEQKRGKEDELNDLLGDSDGEDATLENPDQVRVEPEGSARFDELEQILGKMDAPKSSLKDQRAKTTSKLILPDTYKLPNGHKSLFVRTPNFIKIQSSEFDEPMYNGESERDLFNGSTAVVRWRIKRDANGNEVRDARGQLVKESNARMIQWADGSVQLVVGDAVFQCKNVDVDNCYVYEQQNVQVVESGDEAANSSNLLECVGGIHQRLVLQPMSLDSESHARMSMKISEKHKKESKIGIRDYEQITERPEETLAKIARDEEDAMRRERKIRQQREYASGGAANTITGAARYVRRPTMSAEYLAAGGFDDEEGELGDDRDEGDFYGRERRQKPSKPAQDREKGKGGKPAAKRKAAPSDYLEDDDEDGSEADEDAEDEEEDGSEMEDDVTDEDEEEEEEEDSGAEESEEEDGDAEGASGESGSEGDDAPKKAKSKDKDKDKGGKDREKAGKRDKKSKKDKKERRRLKEERRQAKKDKRREERAERGAKPSEKAGRKAKRPASDDEEEQVVRAPARATEKAVDAGAGAGSGDEGADDEVAVQQRKRVKRTIIDSDEDE